MAMKTVLQKAASFFLVVILALVAVVFLVIFSPKAHAGESQFKWEHFGADPYASSREESMRTRESVFRQFGFPPDVVWVFLMATDKPGEKIRLVNGDHLDVMLSKGGVAHRNVSVAFVKPPVNGKMEYAAPAEKWEVTMGGKTYVVILPEVCNNWSAILPLSALKTVSIKTPLVFKPIMGTCPDVYTLKVNVWERKAMSLPGVERTHANEELALNFLVPRISRTHGGQFRKAYAAGEASRSATTHNFRVSFIMTPESQGGEPTITSEEIVGDVAVVGMRELRFTRAQLEQWDAIRLVPIEDSGILSPPRFSKTGLHELRYFNHLPRTKLGEWDNNPVPDCIMNEHWIEE